METVEAGDAPLDREQPARIGIDVPAAAHRELKQLALDLRTTVTALAAEGVAHILAKNNRPVDPELPNAGRKKRGRPKRG
jgi:hypothetical protein